MREKSEESKNIFKKWLETLQQESWQLELLISGLALFGVFGAKELLDSLESFLDVQFFRGSARAAKEIFIFLLRGSWYIFLINLVIHIVLRGLWIGAIGLRYVSEDIDYDQLNFSQYFRKLYTRRYESFDDYIEDLERICSVIFAYTFLLFFILISACLVILWPLIIFSLIGEQAGGMVVVIYMLLGMIVFIDFIFLNPLKKISGPWFGKIYGFIFRFYSTITLSFIFRPLLLNFLDNKFTKRLFLLSIPYGILIIILVPQITAESIAYLPDFQKYGISSRGYNSEAFNPYLYDDLRPETNEPIGVLSFRNYVITGSVLEFFLGHRKSDEIYFDEKLGIPKLNKLGIYTGFRSNSAVDSTFEETSDKLVAERVDFLDNKRDNPDLHSPFVWDSLYNVLSDRHDSIKYELYALKMEMINDAFKGMCKIYIDDIEITDQVDCLMTQHDHKGESGWKCVTVLDSLSQGLHKFRLERNIYQTKIKVLSPRILEIPFILDQSY